MRNVFLGFLFAAIMATSARAQALRGEGEPIPREIISAAQVQSNYISSTTWISFSTLTVTAGRWELNADVGIVVTVNSLNHFDICMSSSSTMCDILDGMNTNNAFVDGSLGYMAASTVTAHVGPWYVTTSASKNYYVLCRKNQANADAYPSDSRCGDPRRSFVAKRY